MMKSLTTNVGTYVTGDTLADAVMSYSLELARLQRIDDVVIPFRAGDGSIRRAQFSVGWMMTVDSLSTGEQLAELTDAAVEGELRALQDSLHPRGDSEMSSHDFRDADGFEDY